MIAALFVASDGPYSKDKRFDAWDVGRNAKLYDGPHKVIAHPPCERWGRYWSGGPSVKEQRTLGDDQGCFQYALMAVRKFGGVLEHPEASHAFKFFGIRKPNRNGGWIPAMDGYYGWVCCVEQGHYGHKARKATWLYYVGPVKPPDLTWGPSQGIRLDEGFHSTEERKRARANGIKPIKRLTERERIHTPKEFVDVLYRLATFRSSQIAEEK